MRQKGKTARAHILGRDCHHGPDGDQGLGPNARTVAAGRLFARLSSGRWSLRKCAAIQATGACETIPLLACEVWWLTI